MSDPVGNPEDQFSCVVAHIKLTGTCFSMIMYNLE